MCDSASITISEAKNGKGDNQQVKVQGEPDVGAYASSEMDEEQIFKTDSFRMYYMKVVSCPKHAYHDWSECPYAHPGEKTTRRDPRTNSYTGIICPDMKKNRKCIRGSACPFAHSVFEYWLHPTRYRTVMCTDAEKCKRKFCFFAHSQEELRTPDTAPFLQEQEQAAAEAANRLTSVADRSSANGANSTAAAVEDNRLGLYEIGKSFSEPHGRGIQSHRNRGRGPGRAKKRCKDAAGSPPIPCCQLDQGPISPRQLAAYIAGVAHALHNNHEEQGPLPQPVPNQATAGALWDWGLDNAQLPQSFLQQAVEGAMPWLPEAQGCGLAYNAMAESASSRQSSFPLFGDFANVNPNLACNAFAAPALQPYASAEGKPLSSSSSMSFQQDQTILQSRLLMEPPGNNTFLDTSFMAGFHTGMGSVQRSVDHGLRSSMDTERSGDLGTYRSSSLFSHAAPFDSLADDLPMEKSLSAESDTSFTDYALFPEAAAPFPAATAAVAVTPEQAPPFRSFGTPEQATSFRNFAANYLFRAQQGATSFGGVPTFPTDPNQASLGYNSIHSSPLQGFQAPGKAAAGFPGVNPVLMEAGADQLETLESLLYPRYATPTLEAADLSAGPGASQGSSPFWMDAMLS